MAFATFLLFVVLPGMTFSLDTFSSFVDFHNNVCPYKDESCKDIFEEVGLESPCCSFCDCDLVTCKEYGTCCLGVHNSFEAAYESVSQTV